MLYTPISISLFNRHADIQKLNSFAQPLTYHLKIGMGVNDGQNKMKLCLGSGVLRERCHVNRDEDEGVVRYLLL